MKKEIKYIGVAGNIGAGKTTLTEKLGKHFNWEAQFESTEENPYLSDFYDDMHRWSFNLQVYFLHSRYNQILNILAGNQTVIQDRTIYEDAFIFAPNLRDMNLMPERDYDTYLQLFDLMTSQIQAPDLLIYLKSSIPTLVKQIHKRGRAYEGSISLDYLKRLNERYDTWIANYDIGKVLVINADELDFAENPKDLGEIIQRIQAELHGLF